MIIAVPAVMTSTISAMFGAVNSSGGKMSTPRPVVESAEWNRNTNPVDCRSASTTVT